MTDVQSDQRPGGSAAFAPFGQSDYVAPWDSPVGATVDYAEVDADSALVAPSAEPAMLPAGSAASEALSPPLVAPTSTLSAPTSAPAAPSAEPAAPVEPAEPNAPTRRHEIITGIRLSFAAGLGMFPIGVAFGLLVVQSGLPWWVAPGLSIFLFAGSVELLLVGLMVVGTPLATIALTTLLVNFRHVFYAFSFPLRVVRHPLARLYSVYALVDEAYAVSAARPGTWTGPRLVAMQMAFQSYWVGGGLFGVAIASFLPGQIEGLDFALCALFITLTLDACRSRREVPSLLLAALAFSLALVLVPGSALFAGLLGFLALLVARFLITSRRKPADA